jgi:hypothetical protein
MQYDYTTSEIKSAIICRSTYLFEEGPEDVWHMDIVTNDHTSIFFTDIFQSLEEDEAPSLAGKEYTLTDPDELGLPDIFARGKGLVRPHMMRFQFGDWFAETEQLEATITFHSAAHDISIRCILQLKENSWS